MPNGMQMLDSGLPRFTGTENTEDKVAAIQNYLFMLLEELRYILQNLGTDNFNSAELDGLKTEIRNAVKIDLSSGGDMATIQVDLAGLHTSIRNAEGNISTLEQTAQEIRTEVAGKIDGVQAQTMISQGLNSIRLTAAEGDNQSTITIYANGVLVDSAVAKFQRIVADSIETGDGKYVLTTDNTVGNQSIVVYHVESGVATPILKVFDNGLGTLQISSIYEPLISFDANGGTTRLELPSELVKLNHKFAVGADSFGYDDPISLGISGEAGQVFFEIVS